MALEMESSKTDVTSFMTFVTDWFVGVCGSLAQMLENRNFRPKSSITSF